MSALPPKADIVECNRHVGFVPRDAEVASNAIAKLNQYKARGDQREDKNLPTALPTALKTTTLKQEKV